MKTKKKMKTKKFHISDVLSITTGNLISTRHIKGVFGILNFMTGGKLRGDQLPGAIDECKPYLLEQFPQLGTPEMQSAVDDLTEIQKDFIHEEKPNMPILQDWLSKLTSGKYGVKCEEMLEVKPLPKSARVRGT